MTKQQIERNIEVSRKYSEENKCTVWVMCSRYYNNDDEQAKELVGVYNQLTLEAMKENDFWVAGSFINGVRQ
jgi:hypothetical protein